MKVARQINLYDPGLQRQRELLSLGNVVAAGVVLAVVVGVAGSWMRQDLPALQAQAAANEGQLKTMRDQIAALGQQVSGRKPDQRIEQELGAARLLLEMRGQVFEVLKHGLGPDADSYAEYLRGLARQAVPGLWLTGFAFDATGGGLEIEGRTVDPALLPEYIRRLNKERAFQGRAFAALRLSEGKLENLPGPAGASGIAPAPAPRPVGAKAPYHEFKLVPEKDAAKAGKSQVLTRAPGAGGAG